MLEEHLAAFEEKSQCTREMMACMGEGIQALEMGRALTTRMLESPDNDDKGSSDNGGVRGGGGRGGGGGGGGGGEGGGSGNLRTGGGRGMEPRTTPARGDQVELMQWSEQR